LAEALGPYIFPVVLIAFTLFVMFIVYDRVRFRWWFIDNEVANGASNKEAREKWKQRFPQDG
jgi:hypothetical protein